MLLRPGHRVLDLAAGGLLPDGHTGLAVLCPRALSVWSVDRSHGPGKELSRAYAHRLGNDGRHFTAFNMCIGDHGGGRALICVQSMDGRSVADFPRGATLRSRGSRFHQAYTHAHT